MTLAMSKCEVAAGTRCRASRLPPTKQVPYHLRSACGRLRQRHRARTMHKASPSARFLVCAHPQTDEIARILFGQALSFGMMRSRAEKVLPGAYARIERPGPTITNLIIGTVFGHE